MCPGPKVKLMAPEKEFNMLALSRQRLYKNRGMQRRSLKDLWDRFENYEGVSTRSPNLRSTALRSFFRFASVEASTLSAQIQGKLAIVLRVIRRPEQHGLDVEQFEADPDAGSIEQSVQGYIEVAPPKLKQEYTRWESINGPDPHILLDVATAPSLRLWLQSALRAIASAPVVAWAASESVSKNKKGPAASPSISNA